MPARALPPEIRGFSCSPCTSITCAGSTQPAPSPPKASKFLRAEHGPLAGWKPGRAGKMLNNWCFEGVHAIPWAGTGLGFTLPHWQQLFLDSLPDPGGLGAHLSPPPRLVRTCRGSPPGKTPSLGLQRGWRGRQGFPSPRLSRAAGMLRRAAG